MSSGSDKSPGGDAGFASIAASLGRVDSRGPHRTAPQDTPTRDDRLTSRPGRALANRCPGQFAGPNSSESQDSSGVTCCSSAPTRVEAEPGASGPGVGTDGSSVNGISLSVPRS